MSPEAKIYDLKISNTTRRGRILRGQIQSRKASMTEAILNVVSGFFIAFFITQELAPYLGIDIPVLANIKLTIILTVVSIVRGYLWRRYFNGR